MNIEKTRLVITESNKFNESVQLELNSDFMCATVWLTF